MKSFISDAAPHATIFCVNTGICLLNAKVLQQRSGSSHLFKKPIGQICKSPSIGSPRFFNNPKLIGLRSWVVQDFSSIRVYYLLSGDTIRIIRVLHGKRDVGRVFENDADDD